MKIYNPGTNFVPGDKFCPCPQVIHFYFVKCSREWKTKNDYKFSAKLLKIFKIAKYWFLFFYFKQCLHTSVLWSHVRSLIVKNDSPWQSFWQPGATQLFSDGIFTSISRVLQVYTSAGGRTAEIRQILMKFRAKNARGFWFFFSQAFLNNN